MSWVNAKIAIFCFFVVLFDGYDIGAVSYAGPSLVKEWGLTNMIALGTAFSAGLFGILFGSLLFGWVTCWPIDKYGFIPLSIIYLFALIVTPLIGFASGTEWVLVLVVFCSGYALFSLQFGINATSAMIYPTSIRANGSGWAFGIGRFGAIAGPVVAGVLIGMHLSIQYLFLFLAIPMTIATLASLILARLYYVRFQGSGLGRREAMEGAAAGGD